MAFFLPEMGEYVLELRVFSRSEAENNTSDYVVTVREAVEYERLMSMAGYFGYTEQYVESISAYSQVTEYAPDAPTPYLLQNITYVKMLFNSPTYRTDSLAIWDDVVEPLDNATEVQAKEIELEAFLQTFRLLEAEDQAIVVNNWRQMARLYATTVENDETSSDYDEVRLFNDAADFLETGVASDYLKENYRVLLP